MAEKLDENAERAQFEQDVLKAAQDAMNLEANASKGESVANEDAADKAADAEGASENQTEEKAAEQQAEPSAAPDPTEILKQQLADANDRNLRLMAEFENFRRRNAKEQLELIETANGKLLEKLSEVQVRKRHADDLQPVRQGSHGRRPRTDRPDRQGIRPEPPRSLDAAALRNHPGRSRCHRFPERLQTQEQNLEDRKSHRLLRKVTPIRQAQGRLRVILSEA